MPTNEDIDGWVDLLRDASFDYDVDEGLSRHQALVSGGGVGLPRSAGSHRWTWLLAPVGAGAVAVALGLSGTTAASAFETGVGVASSIDRPTREPPAPCLRGASPSQVAATLSARLDSRKRPIASPPLPPTKTAERRPPPEEAELLRRARRAAKNSPRRALALLRRAERLYPEGALEQERKALAVLTGLELGRGPKAIHAAQRFVARYPEGPFSDRVRQRLRLAVGDGEK